MNMESTEDHQDQNPAPATEAAAPAPVMDVTPPPAQPEVDPTAESVIEHQPSPEAVPEVEPEAVVPEAVAQEEPHVPESAAPHEQLPEQHMDQPVPQKPAGNGMTMIIVGTVIVVLLLCGIAVFAYMQSK